MDFNSILIPALIAAISIGGAVGIGELLKKAAPERFHQIITYGAIFVGVAAMTLASNWHRGHQIETEIEAALDEGDVLGGALFKVIKVGLPEEYAAFLQKVRKARTEEEGGQLGFELTSSIRRNYSEQIRASSTAEIRGLFEDDRQLTKLIFEQKGWEVCNAYLGTGGAAIVDLGEPFAGRLVENSVRLFEVLAASKAKPLLRSAPADEDWAAFGEHWRLNGASEEDLSLFITPDFKREETCHVYTSFYDTLSAYEGDAADRLRTEVVILKAKS